MSSDITVVIATIPIRAKMLRKALASVVLQTFQPAAIVVEYDHEHTGAAATKNRGLAKVTTGWVAFLDDDDQFMPEHLGKLREAQLDSGADVVYSMPFIPQISGGIDPSGMRGAPFDPDELRRRSYIQTTSLVRTKLMQSTGGFQLPRHVESDYDDWGAWLALLDAGAAFYHLAEQTFVWEHHGRNTSGRADRW
ncbi:MAG TPA: glycosyltransferase [Pseudonocardiaceae bacterium]|jgi:glycosyltransferase involved in cell wall biosynthesis